MCMDKRNEFGEKNCLFFADKTISEVVLKICSFVNYVTLCVLFV